RPLSVAEVLEIVPAEDSWVNDGVSAVVRSIKASGPNAKRKFWEIILADTVGSATIRMAIYKAPHFNEGDVIDITGSGIKRKEYQGTAEISIGQKTEIHVVGRSAHHEEQKHRAETGAPSVNGELQKVAGQTVGMALKESINLVLDIRGGAQGLDLND